MKLKLVLVLLVAAVCEARRPPWYKPCWIYLCGLDLTDPVCAWDPRHGARLFRNDCEMNRHNFCYSRNYAIIDGENSVAEDMKLCNRLKTLVENAEEGSAAVVQDGNVRVHFLEEPVGQSHVLQSPEDPRGGLRTSRRDRDRLAFTRARTNRKYDDSDSSQEDTAFII